MKTFPPFHIIDPDARKRRRREAWTHLHAFTFKMGILICLSGGRRLAITRRKQKKKNGGNERKKEKRKWAFEHGSLLCYIHIHIVHHDRFVQGVRRERVEPLSSSGCSLPLVKSNERTIVLPSTLIVAQSWCVGAACHPFRSSGLIRKRRSSGREDPLIYSLN